MSISFGIQARRDFVASFGSVHEVPVEQSVTDMRKVINGRTPADMSKFIGNDGLVIPRISVTNSL